MARSNHALRLLALVSFLETVIVPIPIEVVLIPYMLAERQRIWLIATVTTLGCIAGAVVGYGIGYFLFESVGQWAIQTLGWQQMYDQFQAEFETHGFFAILLIGVTPIPFQVAMIGAGLAAYPLWLFVAAPRSPAGFAISG